MKKTVINEKKFVTAFVAGITAFMALSSAVPAIAEELPDISEKVGEQEVYTNMEDFNSITLNSIDAPNKIFVGWNTKPDGSGKTYKPGDKLDISKSVEIYPIWEDINLEIEINGQKENIKSGEDVNLKKISINVDEGISVDPSNMNIKIKANEGCTVEAEYMGIDVSKAVETSQDQMTIYPMFETSYDKVSIKPKYELKVIKDGKIISKSTVSVPVTLKPGANYFKADIENRQVTVVHDDGTAETIDYEDVVFDKNE